MSLVNSVPATFTLTGTQSSDGSAPAINTALTFAIPAGTYSAAYWQIDGTLSNVPLGAGVSSWFFFETNNVSSPTWQFSVNGNSGINPTSLESAYIAAVGDLQNPGFAIQATSAGDPFLNLALINAAAGGSLTVYIGFPGGNKVGFIGSPGSCAVSRCTLNLIPAGGGTPVSYIVTATGGSGGGGGGGDCNGGCDTLTFQMLDASGHAANAPSGGQTFTFTSSSSTGTFLPASLTIPAGASSGTVTYCDQFSGTYTLTVISGAGPLSGLPPRTLTVSVCGAPGDTNTSVCNVTRPLMRDAIRRKLGIEPPIDTGLGLAGDEPRGQRYPTNPALNQFIGDAIRYINTEGNLHVNIGVSFTIPAYPPNWQGPALISLVGDPVCAGRLSINNVKRVVYTDTAGNMYRLRATSYFDRDRNLYAWDTTFAGSQPIQFAVEAASLLIWPAPLTAGTLSLYVGTSFPNFTSDSDWLDQLPIDYQKVIEDWATVFACQARPNEPNNLHQYQMYRTDALRGLALIKKWHAHISEEYITGFVPDKGRRWRVR